jgi:hypothetical protein
VLENDVVEVTIAIQAAVLAGILPPRTISATKWKMLEMTLPYL